MSNAVAQFEIKEAVTGQRFFDLGQGTSSTARIDSKVKSAAFS